MIINNYWLLTSVLCGREKKTGSENRNDYETVNRICISYVSFCCPGSGSRTSIVTENTTCKIYKSHVHVLPGQIQLTLELGELSAFHSYIHQTCRHTQTYIHAHTLKGTFELSCVFVEESDLDFCSNLHCDSCQSIARLLSVLNRIQI